MNKRKGFTLIEMLVVLTILIIFASIVYGLIDKGKPAARDAARVDTLDMLQGALDTYYAQYHQYPCGQEVADDQGINGDGGNGWGDPDFNTGGTKSVSSGAYGFLSTSPASCPGPNLYSSGLISSPSLKDPINDQSQNLVYVYYVDSTRQNYMLATHLESRSDLMKIGKDGGPCDDVYEVGPLKSIADTSYGYYPVAWQAADPANAGNIPACDYKY